MSEDAGRIFPLPVATPPEQAAGFFCPRSGQNDQNEKTKHTQHQKR